MRDLDARSDGAAIDHGTCSTESVFHAGYVDRPADAFHHLRCGSRECAELKWGNMTNDQILNISGVVRIYQF